MKQFRKTGKGFFGNRTSKNSEKSEGKVARLKRLENYCSNENTQKPMAPHNTTQFIIDQTPLYAFDTDELLGSLYLLSTESYK